MTSIIATLLTLVGFLGLPVNDSETVDSGNINVGGTTSSYNGSTAKGQIEY